MPQPIEIRAFFGGWHPASKQSAYKFIKELLSSAQAIDKSNEKQVSDFVSNHLRGIKWEELKNEHLQAA